MLLEEGTRAVYRGKEYSAYYDNEKDTVLMRSPDIEDVRQGFKKVAKEDGYWDYVKCIKRVNRCEVERLFQRRNYGIYKGYKFEVDGEKDGKISIVSLYGDYELWPSMGMEIIDQGVYQKWAPKDEVEILVEEKDISPSDFEEDDEDEEDDDDIDIDFDFDLDDDKDDNQKE